MKKVKYFLLLILLFPMMTYAVSNTIYLNENKTGEIGSEVSYELTANFDASLKEKINKIEFTVNVDDPNGSLSNIYSVTKMTSISNWNSSNTGKTYTYTKTTGDIESGDKFVELSFKINQNATVGDVVNISIVDVKYYVEDSEEYIVGQGNAKSLTVKGKDVESSVVKSNIAKLATLSVSLGELSPVFDPEIETYNLQLKDTITRVTVSATCAENCKSINSYPNGTYRSKVNLTKNEITQVKITVISEDGMNAKNYTINIARGEVINDEADLKSITIENIVLSPEFKSDVLEYTAEVENDVNELKIKYELVNDESKAEIIGGTNLISGENIVKIHVESKDKLTTKDYIIKVIKKDEESSSDISSSSTVPVIPEDGDDNNKLISIILIALFAVILIVVAFVVIFKKKKEDTKVEKTLKNDAKPDVTISHDNDEELLELTKEFRTLTEDEINNNEINKQN